MIRLYSVELLSTSKYTARTEAEELIMLKERKTANDRDPVPIGAWPRLNPGGQRVVGKGSG